jgi:ribosome-interacting GTPase 1
MQVVPISATQKINIDGTKKCDIQKILDIITDISQAKRGKYGKASNTKGAQSTVGDAAAKLHTEILDNLKCAYITDRAQNSTGKEWERRTCAKKR